MNPLLRSVAWLRNRFSDRRGRRAIQRVRPPPLYQGENPGGPHQDRVVHALREIFTPQHKSENEIQFQTISQDGRVSERTEEFRREANTRSARFRRTLVETVSGSVLPPELVRGRCLICRGFEDEAVAFCAVCGKCCCRRCQRRFSHGATEVVLCETHYRAACDAVNTWAQLDQAPGNRAS